MIHRIEPPGEGLSIQLVFSEGLWVLWELHADQQPVLHLRQRPVVHWQRKQLLLHHNASAYFSPLSPSHKSGSPSELFQVVHMSSTLMCRSAWWKLLCLAVESWYFRSSLRNWRRTEHWHESRTTLKQESAHQLGATKKEKVLPLCAPSTVHRPSTLCFSPVQEWMGNKQTTNPLITCSTTEYRQTRWQRHGKKCFLPPVRAETNI